MEYTQVNILYTAGSSPGVEEFEVFFFDGYGGSAPDRRAVRIVVR